RRCSGRSGYRAECFCLSRPPARVWYPVSVLRPSGKKRPRRALLSARFRFLSQEGLMSDRTEQVARRLEAFRSYLGLLARLHLDPALAGKVDLSGVVQQTLYKSPEESDTPGPTPTWALP